MNEQFPQIFPAETSLLAFYIAIGIAILAGATYLYFRNKKTPISLVINMLAGFALMIALSTAFFNLWEKVKLIPVTVDANSIETPYGKANMTDISNAFIEPDKTYFMGNQTATRDTIWLLLIEEYSGQSHVMSSINYDVDGIMSALRAAKIENK